MSGVPLTQTERDLNRYASGKAYTLMCDVKQAFEIAGLGAAQAGACIGALFMRLAAHIAVAAGHDRASFLRWANECFDLATESENQPTNPTKGV